MILDVQNQFFNTCMIWLNGYLKIKDFPILDFNKDEYFLKGFDISWWTKEPHINILTMSDVNVIVRVKNDIEQMLRFNRLVMLMT